LSVSAQTMRFMKWSPGEPNNSQGRENSVNLWYSNNKWGYNDGYEMDKLRYVCEMSKN